MRLLEEISEPIEQRQSFKFTAGPHVPQSPTQYLRHINKGRKR